MEGRRRKWVKIQELWGGEELAPPCNILRWEPKLALCRQKLGSFKPSLLPSCCKKGEAFSHEFPQHSTSQLSFPERTCLDFLFSGLRRRGVPVEPTPSYLLWDLDPSIMPVLSSLSSGPSQITGSSHRIFNNLLVNVFLMFHSNLNSYLSQQSSCPSCILSFS